MKKDILKNLVYIALYSALFIVFDYISNSIPLFKMPQGGRLNLGSVVLILESYHLGLKRGMLGSLVTILIMVIIGSADLSYGIISFLLDYVVGYLAYSISCIFKNYKYFFSGILFTTLIRLTASTISGVVVFETNFLASLLYQLTYLIPTMILDLVLVPILYNKLKPLFKK